MRKLANSDIEYHSYSLPLILKVRTHYRALCVGSVGAASLGVKEQAEKVSLSTQESHYCAATTYVSWACARII